MLMIQKILQSSMNYQLVRCYPDFPRTAYGEQFFDQPGTDGFTTLSAGISWWLINICPGYLVFWQENVCIIEPYLLSWFAR